MCVHAFQHDVCYYLCRNRYRILAVDHDMLSFVDKTYPEMPVILMTNPKDARFIVPEQEPTDRMLLSTHIRYDFYLIWSFLASFSIFYLICLNK